LRRKLREILRLLNGDGVSNRSAESLTKAFIDTFQNRVVAFRPSHYHKPQQILENQQH
jgi:hypothetical protein